MYTMHHYYQEGPNKGNREFTTVHSSLEEVNKIYALIAHYQKDYMLRPTVFEVMEDGTEKRVLGF